MLTYKKQKIHAEDLVLFFFRLHYVAYEILGLQPGMEPVPPPLGVRSLNH